MPYKPCATWTTTPLRFLVSLESVRRLEMFFPGRSTTGPDGRCLQWISIGLLFFLLCFVFPKSCLYYITFVVVFCFYVVLLV